MALKTALRALYDDAAVHQKTICVPHADSFNPKLINKDFAESHILTASPYFAGQYITTNGKACEMEHGETWLRTGDGYTQTGRCVKILAENVFYNKDYKAYRVLLTDSALEGPQKRVEASADEKHKYADVVPAAERTFHRLLQFLVSFAGIEAALQRIDISVRNFNRTYEIVEGWEEQVGRYCDHMVHRAKDLVFGVSAVRHYAVGCDAHMELIEEAVESYVMGGVHDKIFQDLLTVHGEEDTKLAQLLANCQVLPQDLGVRDDLCAAPLDTAVVALRGLAQGGVITPREKLCAVQRCTLALTSSAEEHLALQGKTSSQHALTTDDLLPLLCLTLIKAAPSNLVTHSVYLTNFNSPGTSTTELGFHLANFQAAVQFLRQSPLVQQSALEAVNDVQPVDLSSDSYGSCLMDSHVTTHASTHVELPPLVPPPATGKQHNRLQKSGSKLVSRHVAPVMVHKHSEDVMPAGGLGEFLDTLLDEGSRSISSRQYYSQTEQ